MGSGFIISGRRILAHCLTVDNHRSSFRVRKFGSSTFYTAKVESVAYDCALATLVVEWNEFWEHTHPLELHDDLPSIGDTVSVLTNDYDTTIKLVEGAVTSVETREYFHGTREL
ncbi:PREDICTED: putative protease Do-like 6, chloroplastic isoform X1 [Brassica oleracea var. oleracea]|nr:PREDICTED: putative protease Do-like 6, chloroplastic isoform X1 [Brassica oleracea var. oleracea]